MSQAKQSSKRKRRGKTVPMLGAAGLSLSLASGAPAAIGGLAADIPMRNIGVSEIALGEEELCDVSLATFHVFDRENAGPFRRGVRLAMGGCGCGGGGGELVVTDGPSTNYAAPTLGRYWIKPAPKYTKASRRTHFPRNR